MKTTTLASLFSSAVFTNAQLAYDHSTQSLKCALPSGNYCVGDSMSQSYIAHCNAGIATISCCTSELSSLPPLGLKPTALCFQSSTTIGDASCALNGTIYTAKGPKALPAPVTPTEPIPAVTNTADEPPEECECHDGTNPLGPPESSGLISPPLSLPSETPASPIIPPSAPVSPPAVSTPESPIVSSAPSHPIVPPPASTPVSPIHPTAPAPSGYDGHAILPTGTAIPPKPTTTSQTSFLYTIGKPTSTPSSTVASPVQNTNAAERRGVPTAIIGVAGAVLMLF
ncbi:putative pyrophosphatase/phosphodiesterase [Venturia nashicola]|nr:putative pyrophosphatase/phosphodiesterase [Venturia nashicola]